MVGAREGGELVLVGDAGKEPERGASGFLGWIPNKSYLRKQELLPKIQV